jgi:hypothetical protein
LLPSGPGGVRHFPSRGAQPSTPSHTAHSTRAPLKGEFNPAVADCGLQGTATSPSSTAKSKMAEGVGFEPTVQLPVHGISSAAPSATRPPLHTIPATTTLLEIRRKWRRGEDLNPRGTYAPIRFRVGRLQPGSATPPHIKSLTCNTPPDWHQLEPLRRASFGIVPRHHSPSPRAAPPPP